MTSAMRHREEQEVDRQHDGDGHEPLGDVAPDESSAHGVHGDGQHQGEEGGADDARRLAGAGQDQDERAGDDHDQGQPGQPRSARHVRHVARRMPGRRRRDRGCGLARARRRPPAPRHPWWLGGASSVGAAVRAGSVPVAVRRGPCRHQPRSLAFWAANSSSVSTPASRSSPSCLSWLITSAWESAEPARLRLRRGRVLLLGRCSVDLLRGRPVLRRRRRVRRRRTGLLRIGLGSLGGGVRVALGELVGLAALDAAADGARGAGDDGGTGHTSE